MQRGRRSPLILLLLSLAACNTIDHPDETVLDLGEGDVVDTYEFEALDPTEWSFTVNVLAPIGTVVDVNFTTTDGATLNVFQTPSDLTNSGCVEEPKGYLDCTSHFPLLEGRTPGTWTATVHKKSEPPADVHVAVAWENETDSG